MSTPSKSDHKFWDKDDIHWLTIPDLESNKIEVSNTINYVSKYALENKKIRIVPKNSVLISCTATIGKIGINLIELATNQQINAIVCTKKVLPHYLGIILKVYGKSLEELTSNPGVKHVNLQMLSNFKIPLPPLDVQKGIIAEIEAFGKKEDKVKKDIEAGKNKIELLFNNIFAKSKDILRLSDNTTFDISIGKRLLKNEILPEGNYPVFSANVFEPFGYINELLIQDFSVPSVLWGIDGDWMVNYYPKNKPFYPTDHCGVLRVRNNAVNERYLAFVLEAEGKSSEFSRAKRASIDKIQNIKIPVPPLPEQQKVVSEIEKIESKITALEKELAEICQQKEVVLKKYL